MGLAHGYAHALDTAELRPFNISPSETRATSTWLCGELADWLSNFYRLLPEPRKLFSKMWVFWAR